MLKTGPHMRQNKADKKDVNMGNKTKDSFIKFRIAESEKVIVSKKAESQGLNVSEYIRRLALDDVERVLS